MSGPVLLYDGDCGFCSKSVQFVLRHNSAGNICFAALQSDVGRDLCAPFGIDTTQLSSLVFIEDGSAWQRSRAVARLCRHLDWPWRVATVLRVTPSAFADAVYNLVASQRYRLAGRSDSCLLPTPEQRDRFLDRAR